MCKSSVVCIKWPSTAPKQPITWQIIRTQTFYEGDFRSQEIKGVMEDGHTWWYDTNNYYLQHFFLPGFSCTRFKTLCINSSSLTCSILKQEGGSEGYPRQKKNWYKNQKDRVSNWCTHLENSAIDSVMLYPVFALVSVYKALYSCKASRYGEKIKG